MSAQQQAYLKQIKIIYHIIEDFSFCYFPLFVGNFGKIRLDRSFYIQFTIKNLHMFL